MSYLDAIDTFQFKIESSATLFASLDFSDATSFEILTPAQLRDELGLIGDSGQNTLVTDYMKTAVLLIESFLGCIIVERQVTDFYEHWGEHLVMSQKFRAFKQQAGNDLASVVYYDSAHELTTAETADWQADFTSEPPSVYVSDSLRGTTVSERFINPIQIRYQGAAISETHPGHGAVVQAIKWYVNLMYYNRGDANADYADNHIKALLQPWQKAFAYA